MQRTALACTFWLSVLLAIACSSASTGAGVPTPADAGGTDASNVSDSPGPVDGSGSTDGDAGLAGDSAPGLKFQCFARSAPPAPNACPPVSGKSGEVAFCFRPQWAGVTSVDVYGGFGQATDWQMPFVSLTNDGSGTFLGTTALGNGTYSYLFRTHGGQDNLARDGQYFLDQENPSFLPSPPGSPSYSANSKVPRSVSAVTVPQASVPVLHLRGTVLYKGQPQPCFSVDLEAGEVTVGGAAKQEHNTANFTESATDGTFDFPLVAAAYGAVVRYPFFLSGADAGYPDPSTTPSLGYARTSQDVAADTTLDPVDVAYPDYAAMAPASGSATLPVTFAFTVIPGAAAASVAVIATDIAGNDPAYWGPFGTATTTTWDGTFGGALGKAKLGTTYYWGTWQRRDPAQDGGTTWSAESLLFPIVFH